MPFKNCQKPDFHILVAVAWQNRFERSLSGPATTIQQMSICERVRSKYAWVALERF